MVILGLDWPWKGCRPGPVGLHEQPEVRQEGGRALALARARWNRQCGSAACLANLNEVTVWCASGLGSLCSAFLLSSHGWTSSSSNAALQVQVEDSTWNQVSLRTITAAPLRLRLVSESSWICTVWIHSSVPSHCSRAALSSSCCGGAAGPRQFKFELWSCPSHRASDCQCTDCQWHCHCSITQPGKVVPYFKFQVSGPPPPPPYQAYRFTGKFACQTNAAQAGRRIQVALRHC